MSMQTPELAVVSLLLGQLHTVRTGTLDDRFRSFPVLRMLEAWSRRALFRREIRRILETDGHLLEDVGFDADMALKEYGRHFWQPVVLKRRRAFRGDKGALSPHHAGRSPSSRHPATSNS